MRMDLGWSSSPVGPTLRTTSCLVRPASGQAGFRILEVGRTEGFFSFDAERREPGGHDAAAGTIQKPPTIGETPSAPRVRDSERERAAFEREWPRLRSVRASSDLMKPSQNRPESW
jgi:hypothetical protein